MIKKLRSFSRQHTNRTVLALVSGGTVSTAEIKRGRDIIRLSDKKKNLLLSGHFPGLKRSGARAKIIVGVEGDNGVAFPVELLWRRERKEERISIAEVRSFQRELTIRSREGLRRLSDAQNVELVNCQQVSMTLDGRRIFNPTGFTGEEIWTAANAIALASQSATVVEKLRRAYPRASIRPVLIDVAAARFVVARTNPDVIVVLGPQATSVLVFDGDLISSRNVFSIGEESMAQHLRRVAPSLSERDIRRYMRAGRETTQRDRELTALATPAARRWARALESAISPFISPDMRMALVSGTTLPTPFAHLLKPQVVRHAFSELHHITIEPVAIYELLSTNPFHTSLDAIFSLLFAHERLDPFVK